jgi:hypothetical protein
VSNLGFIDRLFSIDEGVRILDPQFFSGFLHTVTVYFNNSKVDIMWNSCSSSRLNFIMKFAVNYGNSARLKIFDLTSGSSKGV